MYRACQKILFASAFAAALAACGAMGTSSDSGNNTDASYVNTGEAPSDFNPSGSSGAGGTGTASGAVTPTTPPSSHQQQ